MGIAVSLAICLGLCFRDQDIFRMLGGSVCVWLQGKSRTLELFEGPLGLNPNWSIALVVLRAGTVFDRK